MLWNEVWSSLTATWNSSLNTFTLSIFSLHLIFYLPPPLLIGFVSFSLATLSSFSPCSLPRSVSVFGGQSFSTPSNRSILCPKLSYPLGGYTILRNKHRNARLHLGLSSSFCKKKMHNVLTVISKIVVLCLCVLHVRRKNCWDVEEARERERERLERETKM